MDSKQVGTTQNRAVKVRVVCLECGKKWSTSNLLPVCSKCNSSDIEPASECSK
jgi:hypothetical protein